MNSGADVFRDLGILAHVGQTEYQAGLGAGERLEAGVKNAVCFNEVGNQALTLRCNGFFMGLTGSEEGEVLTGNISDRRDAGHHRGQALVRRHRRRHPDPRTVRRRTALAAVTASGKPIHLAAFDLSADVLTAIKDGKMDFAIDRQFLQGYLPMRSSSRTGPRRGTCRPATEPV